MVSIRAISRPVYAYPRTMVPFPILWYFLALHNGNRAILPAPTDILRTLVTLAIGHELWGHMITSMRRLAVGYGLVIVFGLALTISFAVETSHIESPASRRGNGRGVVRSKWIP